jgi:hypothetical protein
MEEALPDNLKGWLYTADYMYNLNMDDAIYHINRYFELVDENTAKDDEVYKAVTRLKKNIKLRINTHSIN